MKTTFATILLLAVSVTAAFAEEGYDYSARWKAWDTYTRIVYIIGMEEGITMAYFMTIGNLSKKPSSKEQDNILHILKFDSSIKVDKIVEVMTDIYQNPANSYIDTVKVFMLAQDKIEGNDISKRLEDERRKADDFNKLNTPVPTSTK